MKSLGHKLPSTLVRFVDLAVRRPRDLRRVSDVAAALNVLVEHYERRGDLVTLLLAQEGSDGQVRRIVVAGRQLHRDWVQQVFAPYLPADEAPDELVDLLVVATDVLTWKQLRRDLGLSRATTERRMRRLVTALICDQTPHEG
jgi:hypothetical protein